MSRNTRRGFLGDVGRGMVAAGLGASLAEELGYSTAFAQDGPDRLEFGELRPLVDLMRDAPPDELQTKLIKKLQAGETDLRELTAAGALANAETFGGQDYVGFHTAMAFVPAYELAQRLPTASQPLPVLKVIYRNADQIQKEGGAQQIVLRPIDGAGRSADAESGLRLRDASRQGKMDKAERIFATTAEQRPKAMFNVLQHAVQDSIDVHRFVLAHRAFQLIGLVGQQHAHTLLRQSVRLCVDHEQGRMSKNRPPSPIRTLMPKLLDQYKLVGRKLGTRQMDDAWVEQLCDTVYRAGTGEACEAVAEALAYGVHPETVGEAIALAANQLVLRQPASQARAHGDSPGVHASDAMNAWRNMSRVTSDDLAITGLIVGAYHTAKYGPFQSDEYPTDEHRELIRSTAQSELLAEAEDAIRYNDQARAAAASAIYTQQGYPLRPFLALMLRFTISEDGRLHGEKFYQTVVEEYATTRPAFRSRQLVALARVTASAYGYDREDKHGYRAPGYQQACRLLNVEE